MRSEAGTAPLRVLFVNGAAVGFACENGDSSIPFDRPFDKLRAGYSAALRSEWRMSKERGVSRWVWGRGVARRREEGKRRREAIWPLSLYVRRWRAVLLICAVVWRQAVDV